MRFTKIIADIFIILYLWTDFLWPLGYVSLPSTNIRPSFQEKWVFFRDYQQGHGRPSKYKQVWQKHRLDYKSCLQYRSLHNLAAHARLSANTLFQLSAVIKLLYKRSLFTIFYETIIFLKWIRCILYCSVLFYYF